MIRVVFVECLGGGCIRRTYILEGEVLMEAIGIHEGIFGKI